MTLMYTNESLTVASIVSVLRGSATPSVTFSIYYGSDRSGAGTEVVTSGITTTNTTTGTNTTSFNNATIPADNFIWLKTSDVSGLVEELSVTLRFS